MFYDSMAVCVCVQNGTKYAAYILWLYAIFLDINELESVV